MQFLVIEHFRGGDPQPVYERFATKGRLAPSGIEYVASWVTEDLATCYQVMDGTREALDSWIANWSDLVDFEVLPVISSAEAKSRALS